PSSLTLGCSRCTRPIAWRANPDAETIDWRARRGRTAQRVRREGMAAAVPYPYPLAREPRFTMCAVSGRWANRARAGNGGLQAKSRIHTIGQGRTTTVAFAYQPAHVFPLSQ